MIWTKIAHFDDYGPKADAVRVSGRGATPPRFMITDAASRPTFNERNHDQNTIHNRATA